LGLPSNLSASPPDFGILIVAPSPLSTVVRGKERLCGRGVERETHAGFVPLPQLKRCGEVRHLARRRCHADETIKLYELMTI